jgi:hypothetical protein
MAGYRDSFTFIFLLSNRHKLLDLMLYHLKMARKETGWDGVDWIHLAQERDKWRALANTAMNLLVSLHFHNFSSS